MPGYHNHYNDSDFQRGNVRINDGRISGINVETIDQAVERLRKKGEHVVIAAKQALEEGAKIIVKDMEKRVPVYGGKRSRGVIPGLLKQSIQYDVLEDGALIEFSANARNPKDNFLYGQIVEFSEWHMWKGKRRKKEKQEFMYPALDDNKPKVYEMVKNAINQAIARGY